uniref:Uncharacterized protein n=1 Tax=Bombyx mori TaxID=7091 RepID=A0A8R2RCR4_BOMMO|nr:uncharacterized protein LOC119630882 isoform X1 [Bombyx mori]
MRRHIVFYGCSDDEDVCNVMSNYQNVRRESKMIVLRRSFHSVTEKRSQNNDCGENSVTIVTEKKIEDDGSDSSSGENVEIEGKSTDIFNSIDRAYEVIET